jgi:hypothetical protein
MEFNLHSQLCLSLNYMSKLQFVLAMYEFLATDLEARVRFPALQEKKK